MPKKLEPGRSPAACSRCRATIAWSGLLRDGHEAAFEEIVGRYQQPLIAFAAAIVPFHRAEDVVQASLLKAHKALLADEREIALRAWLFTIVRNGALNVIRDDPDWQELDPSYDGVPADGRGRRAERGAAGPGHGDLRAARRPAQGVDRARARGRGPRRDRGRARHDDDRRSRTDLQSPDRGPQRDGGGGSPAAAAPAPGRGARRRCRRRGRRGGLRRRREAGRRDLGDGDRCRRRRRTRAGRQVVAVGPTAPRRPSNVAAAARRQRIRARSRRRPRSPPQPARRPAADARWTARARPRAQAGTAVSKRRDPAAVRAPDRARATILRVRRAATAAILDRGRATMAATQALVAAITAATRGRAQTTTAIRARVAAVTPARAACRLPAAATLTPGRWRRFLNRVEDEDRSGPRWDRPSSGSGSGDRGLLPDRRVEARRRSLGQPTGRSLRLRLSASPACTRASSAGDAPPPAPPGNRDLPPAAG